MTRQEALHKFYGKVFYKHFYPQLVIFDAYCKEHQEDLAEQFQDAFVKLCAEIQGQQKSGRKGKILCIGIHALRTEQLTQNHTLAMYAYDQTFYLDATPIQISFPMPQLFQFIDQLVVQLSQALTLFFGLITVNDIQMVIQSQWGVFIHYITQLARLSIQTGTIAIFDCIQKEEDFFIISGEYKHSFDEIFISKQETIIEEELRDQISNHQAEAEDFFCKNYHAYDLSHLNLSNINLCKSRFTQCKFNQVTLNRAYLMKSQFVNCEIKGAKIQSAYLFEASYEGSDLSGSDFSCSFGFITTPEQTLYISPGFSGVNFRNTNLSNVRFTDGNFGGADFRGAVFNNTCFEQTVLNGAIFRKYDVDKLNLSQCQLNQIKIE